MIKFLTLALLSASALLGACASQPMTAEQQRLLDDNPTNVQTFDPQALRDQLRQATGASIHP